MLLTNPDFQKLIGIFFLLFTLLLASCSLAQKGAIHIAYERMAEGEYMMAMQRLSAAELHKDASPEVAAEVNYLRAVCLEELDRKDEAEGLYRYVAETFPDTPYGWQAKSRLEND